MSGAPANWTRPSSNQMEAVRDQMRRLRAFEERQRLPIQLRALRQRFPMSQSGASATPAPVSNVAAWVNQQAAPAKAAQGLTPESPMLSTAPTPSQPARALASVPAASSPASDLKKQILCTADQSRRGAMRAIFPTLARWCRLLGAAALRAARAFEARCAQEIPPAPAMSCPEINAAESAGNGKGAA